MLRPSRRARRAILASVVLVGALPVAATAAPPVVVGGPTGFTNDRTPTFTWSDDPLDLYTWTVTRSPGGSVASSGTVDAVGNPDAPLAATSGSLADGAYEFAVTGEANGASDARGFTVDGTAPTFTTTLTPPLNGAGWANTPGGVQAGFACSAGGGAPLVGDTSVAAPLVTAEGTTTATASQACGDAAGNTVTPAATVRIDRTAPVPGAPALSRQPNGTNGWYRAGGGSTITVRFPACSDALSGVASCPSQGVSVDGITTVALTVTDRAGNTAAAPPVEVKRDIRPPLVPRPTGPDGVSNDLQPTLTWAQALDQQPVDVIASGVVAYRVRLNGTVLPDVPAPPDPGQPASLRVAQILPNGSTNSWTVQSIDGAGNVSAQSTPVTFQVDVSAPEPPSFTAGPTNDAATSSASLTFSFTGEAGASFSWELNDDAGQKIASSPAPAPASSASVGPLRDGAYSFRVRQVLPGNRLSGYAVAVFNVDTAAPGAPQVIQSPGTTTTVQPSFGWRAAESGGSFVWEVTGPGGAVVAGPGRVTADAVQLPALPAGAFVFRVRQRDRAGNLGDWSAPEPFTIIAAAGGTTTTPARRTTRVPATVNSRWLRPAKGGKVSPKRVTLRWRRVRAASLYNVQLFRVDGQRYTKVLGTFTRGTRYTVKGRYLRRNTRYVWRVWPYIARSRSYTRRALGISYFDTRAR